MSPLRGTPPCGNPKQGSRAKKLDSRFRGNDKYCFREDISLDFWAQKVYRFLVVVNSVLKESIGAIWFNEEDSHLSSFWW